MKTVAVLIFAPAHRNRAQKFFFEELTVFFCRALLIADEKQTSPRKIPFHNLLNGILCFFVSVSFSVSGLCHGHWIPATVALAWNRIRCYFLIKCCLPPWPMDSFPDIAVESCLRTWGPSQGTAPERWELRVGLFLCLFECLGKNSAPGSYTMMMI